MRNRAASPNRAQPDRPVPATRPERRRGRAGLVAVALACGGLLAAACGGGSGAGTSTHAGASSSKATVRVAKVDHLGRILVTSSGRTLYQFAPDKQKAVTCTTANGCARYWPPLDITHGKPVAGPGLKSSLLGTIKAPGGKTQVTYNRWPLYTYVGDNGPGQAHGEGLKLSGGLWLALKPSGQLAHKSSGSSGGGGHGGGGY